MGRIIINHSDDITPYDATLYVSAIIEMGRVSKDNTSFCLCTRFSDKTIALADTTKAGTDKFYVYKEKRNE